MGSPRFTIVIPNWNGKKYLKGCLESIYRQTHGPLRVIVVDNGSTDGSLEWGKKIYPEVQWIRFEENQGFGAAVNAGIRAADTDYTCLLNNDTELDEWFVEAVLEVFNSRENIDFVAPKMLSFNDRSILDGAGDGFLRGGIGYRIGTMEKDGPIFGQPRPVLAACAGAAVYRRSFFNRVGLFDENFFAYLEDVDLHLRAARAGLKGFYAPKAIVYHIGSASSGGKINPFVVRQTTRNLILLLVKNFSPVYLLKSLPLILLNHLLWVAVVLKNRLIPAYLVGFSQGFAMVCKKTVPFFDRSETTQYDSEAYKLSIKRMELEVLEALVRRRRALGSIVWPFQAYRSVRARLK